jgi:nucleoid-associated protein YgaU
MIFTESRYASGNIFRAYRKISDSYEVTVTRNFPESTSQFVLYTCGDRDRIDQIAYNFYGNSFLWWRIMDYNPEIINPYHLMPGTVLRIPRAS